VTVTVTVTLTVDVYQGLKIVDLTRNIYFDNRRKEQGNYGVGPRSATASKAGL
jgi:hypothetical protein